MKLTCFLVTCFLVLCSTICCLEASAHRKLETQSNSPAKDNTELREQEGPDKRKILVKQRKMPRDMYLYLQKLNRLPMIKVRWNVNQRTKKKLFGHAKSRRFRKLIRVPCKRTSGVGIRKGNRRRFFHLCEACMDKKVEHLLSESLNVVIETREASKCNHNYCYFRNGIQGRCVPKYYTIILPILGQNSMMAGFKTYKLKVACECIPFINPRYSG